MSAHYLEKLTSSLQNIKNLPFPYLSSSENGYESVGLFTYLGHKYGAEYMVNILLRDNMRQALPFGFTG